MSQGYLQFPNIDPVLVSIGPVSIRWYGLMYLVGFMFALWLANRRADKQAAAGLESKSLIYFSRAS